MAATKWQYRIQRGDLSQEALDELGQQGWDLVSVIANDDEPHFYFKRPYPSLAERITLEQRERYFGEWGVGQDRPA